MTTGYQTFTEIKPGFSEFIVGHGYYAGLREQAESSQAAQPFVR